MYPKVKFWGKSVEFQPKGTLTVELPMWNEQYTWSNVNCIVHNVIVGTLWMEQVGTMEIVNQKTKHKVNINNILLRLIFGGVKCNSFFPPN